LTISLLYECPFFDSNLTPQWSWEGKCRQNYITIETPQQNSITLNLWRFLVIYMLPSITFHIILCSRMCGMFKVFVLLTGHWHGIIKLFFMFFIVLIQEKNPKHFSSSALMS